MTLHGKSHIPPLPTILSHLSRMSNLRLFSSRRIKQTYMLRSKR